MRGVGQVRAEQGYNVQSRVNRILDKNPDWLKENKTVCTDKLLWQIWKDLGWIWKSRGVECIPYDKFVGKSPNLHQVDLARRRYNENKEKIRKKAGLPVED